MHVPLKGKLSYLWARATGQDRIYSHVFEGVCEITSETTLPTFVPALYWVRARPFNHQQDRFVLDKCHYVSRDYAVKPARPYEEEMLKLETGNRTIFTRAEAVAMTKRMESAFIRDGMRPLADQPFRGYIETDAFAAMTGGLAPRKKPPPHPHLKLLQGERK